MGCCNVSCIALWAWHMYSHSGIRRIRNAFIIIIIYIQKPLFLLRIWAPRGAAVLVNSLRTKSRENKSWLGMYLKILPHILSLLMTSLLHTDGHKMAALVVLFSRLSEVDFQPTGPEIKWRTVLCQLCFLPVHSYRYVMLLRFRPGITVVVHWA